MIDEVASGEGEYDKARSEAQGPLDASGSLDHRVRPRC